MNKLTYFERLHESVTRIARHSFYPGKEEAVERCLEEIEHLHDCDRISDEQLATLREVLLGEEAACLIEGVARERDPSRAGVEPRGRIAILCQGSGSHAAFSAGVLQGLLESGPRRLRIDALAGSSFGAVNALLAWEGLLRGDRRRGADAIEGFWNDYSASSFLDALLNYSSQMVHHLRGAVSLPGFPACDLAFANHGVPRLLLERRIDLGLIRALGAVEGAPKLVVGSDRDRPRTVDASGGSLSLADLLPVDSGATPRSVNASSLARRDGETGCGPLVRAMARLKPEQLWLIRTQRTPSSLSWSSRVDGPPRADLPDDRLLEMELGFIRKINQLLEKGSLVDRRYRRIEVHQIIMDHDLDAVSELDRSPSLIARLMAYGRDRAGQFLARWSEAPSRRPGRPLSV